MDWLQSLVPVGLYILMTSGIAAGVGALVSNRHLQKHKAKLDRLTEDHRHSLETKADRHRLLLKRQELMFEREYDAAAAFYLILREATPLPWAPNLDHGDAEERLAESLSELDVRLEEYIRAHGTSLSDEALKLVVEAQALANNGAREVADQTATGEYDVMQSANKAVQGYTHSFLKAMRAADRKLRDDLRTGSFGVRP